MKKTILVFILLFGLEGLTLKSQVPVAPTIHVRGSNADKVVMCFRFAIGDLNSNIQLYKDGLLEQEKPCLLAGADYNTPWTRDASINTWNGVGLIYPEVAKNTLISQTARDASGQAIIGGQYWDKMIWTIGAWNYYLFTGDTAFLRSAYPTIVNSLEQLEKTEFDEKLGLFRGASVYGDGVAAYPDIYTKASDTTKNGTFSGIDRWPELNPDKKSKTGYGLPMMALSTNCLYYEVYSLLPQIEKELGLPVVKAFSDKAAKLKLAITDHFWKRKKQTYIYLVDPFGGCDAQEGIGISFALLFGLADDNQAKALFRNTFITKHGIPCLYPSFPRYMNVIDDNVGRHCGTVWPPIQAFWADATIMRGKPGIFEKEFNALTDNVFRDKEFVELYHPFTGERYGGLQEPYLKERKIWFCGDRQSWSASGYLRMVLSGLAGMRAGTDGLSFQPWLPEGIDDLVLKDIPYRKAVLNISISGRGNSIKSCKINGLDVDKPFIPANSTGNISIEIIKK